MKIESYKDLRPGDVWLGMEVSEVQTGHFVYFGSIREFPPAHVQQLIDAGNDEVERTPEEVTLGNVIITDGSNGDGRIHHIDERLYPFIGKRVEVTVRRL